MKSTGISVLEVEGSWNYGVSSASAIQCKLLLRSADDVRVVGAPSWWTTRHVLYIAFILGALVLAFLCLVVYSRVEHWRLRAMHEERERLANGSMTRWPRASPASAFNYRRSAKRSRMDSAITEASGPGL